MRGHLENIAVSIALERKRGFIPHASHDIVSADFLYSGIMVSFDVCKVVLGARCESGVARYNSKNTNLQQQQPSGPHL
jgi:hypothetical protein